MAIPGMGTSRSKNRPYGGMYFVIVEVMTMARRKEGTGKRGPRPSSTQRQQQAHISAKPREPSLPICKWGHYLRKQADCPRV